MVECGNEICLWLKSCNIDHNDNIIKLNIFLKISCPKLFAQKKIKMPYSMNLKETDLSIRLSLKGIFFNFFNIIFLLIFFMV